MRLRAKLLMLVAGLMGVHFLLILLLLQVEQLRQVRRDRIERFELLREVLLAESDVPTLLASLDALERCGIITAWRVARASTDDAQNTRQSAEASLYFPASNQMPGPMPLVQQRLAAANGRPVALSLPVGFDSDATALQIAMPLRTAPFFDGDMVSFLVATVFMAGLMVVVLYLLLQRLVLGPVDEILFATRTLAAGGLPSEVSVGSRSDEMGRLGLAFNRMVREVTDTRAHLEERVAEATARVEQTQRELAFADRLAATGRLAAGVAHEINNPLSGVMNAVRRLEKPDLDPVKRAEYVELCQDGLERMRQIVRRVLDFSHNKPHVADVDVVQPVRAALGLCQHRLEKQNIACVDNLPDALPAVYADAGELQQVVLNLLTNAMDAMPGGGTLTVDAIAGDEDVTLRVCDTGSGLSEEEIAASFDFFHTTKPVGQGTGLGLSISHNLVTRYHGTLRLESEPGAGTCAVVTLPRSSPATHREEIS